MGTPTLGVGLRRRRKSAFGRCPLPKSEARLMCVLHRRLRSTPDYLTSGVHNKSQTTEWHRRYRKLKLMSINYGGLSAAAALGVWGRALWQPRRTYSTENQHPLRPPPLVYPAGPPLRFPRLGGPGVWASALQFR